ncbi:hypothetical protein SAMN05428984_1458 [Sphingomonas sp. OK281]|nr:hypothetical protein SAMN05428984_1458 [Sphingomonas sp. OK281]
MTMGRWRRSNGVGVVVRNARHALRNVRYLRSLAHKYPRKYPRKYWGGRVSPVAYPSLFSREGGSPVWVPAFAGKHGSEECESTQNTTPAEAGAQLGDVTNG